MNTFGLHPDQNCLSFYWLQVLLNLFSNKESADNTNAKIILPLSHLTRQIIYAYLADINISFITMPKQIQEYHHNIKQLRS